MLRGLSALLLATLFAAAATAAPIPRDPPKRGPHFVLQIKPLEGWLGDYDHVYPKIKDVSKKGQIPDPKEVRGFIEMFLPDLKKAVDTSKPWGVYATFQPDLKETRPVLVFPSPEPKVFTETIGKIFSDLTEEMDGIRGFKYVLLFGARQPAFFRFKNDCAYVTFDNISAIKDADKLPDPKDLFVKDDTALLSARLFVEGIPPEVKKSARDLLEKTGEKNGGGFGLQEMILMGMIGATDHRDFIDRMKRVVDEAKWFSLRLDFDRKSDEMLFEFNLIPKNDSALGKEIAAFKPRKTRFGELLEKDTPGGVLYSIGSFGGFKAEEKEFEEMLNAFLDSIHLGGEAEKVRPLAKVVRKTLQVEGVDIGVAVKHTKGANTICLAGAAQVKHARELETSFLVYVNFLPENKRKKFSPNAVKITDTIKAHKITVDLPEDAKDSLGSSDLYMIFLDDAVYVTIGESATTRLKEMLEMKPKEAPSLLMQITPERVAPLMELATGKELKADWSTLFPNNKRVKLLGLHLEGGPMLRVRYSADFVDILKWALSIEN